MPRKKAEPKPPKGVKPKREKPPQLSSESNEHYTPPEVVERARALFGGFIHLDPASCVEANKVVQAGQIYTIADDGLGKEWHGKTFLNPPGGAIKVENKPYSVSGYWWAKLAQEWQRGNVEEAIFIGFTLEILRHSQITSSMPVQRFHRCYPTKRMQFGGQTQPTHGNVIVHLPYHSHPWAESFARFQHHFGSLGLCEPGYFGS